MRSLKDFAAYIKHNRLEQFAANNLRYSRKLEIPLLKFFAHLNEEQLQQLMVKSANDFLTCLEEGTALEVAMENLRKWEADELEIPRDAVHPSDLVFVYTSQKIGLLDLLPDFTEDIREAVVIIRDLEDYYARAQDAAVQMMFKMQKEVEEALREKDRTLAQFLDGLPIGIYIVNSNGKPYFINQAATRLLGISLEEVEKELYDIYNSTTGEPYEKEQMPLTKALNGKDAAVNDMEIRHEGRVVPLEVWGSPVFDRNGSVKFAIVGFNDITERKKAEREIMNKTEELQRSNKELELFASVASHDLQEPLRTIASYLELIERKLKDRLDENTASLMDIAIDASKRMKELIVNLLEYARITRSTSPFTEIEMKDILEDVLGNLRNIIHDTHTQITIDNSITRITGDHYQVVQLFQNLVSNGIKFQKNSQPQIRIEGRETRKFYEFSVKDNGIGIDSRYQHKIFEIFQRLNTRDKYPGTGIGLAICKKIVERHGGDIWLDSKENSGTTFYFTLAKT
jgi:PAS domain S-box-containing protein